MSLELGAGFLLLASIFDDTDFYGNGKLPKPTNSSGFRGNIVYYARYNPQTHTYSILMKVEASASMFGKAIMKTLKPSDRTIYREYIPRAGDSDYLETKAHPNFKLIPTEQYVKLATCKLETSAKELMSYMQGQNYSRVKGLSKATDRTSKEWILDIGAIMSRCGIDENYLRNGNPFAKSNDILRKFILPDEYQREKDAKKSAEAEAKLKKTSTRRALAKIEGDKSR